MLMTVLLLSALAQGDAPHALERAVGWRALFDGHSTEGWRGFGRAGFPDSGWDVVDGCLHHTAGGGGGDLVTTETFGDFELELEWRIASGGNSGIKLRVQETPGARHPVAPEYQLLDASAHRDGLAAKRTVGAAYDLFAPELASLPVADEFHSTRIVMRGGAVEHWLDGRRVLAYEIGSDAWRAAVAASKFEGVQGFGTAPRGHVALQDHGDEVWFRRIRIRPLDDLRGAVVELFDGATLAGWTPLGDALWTPEDGTLLGEVGGGRQSFLASERAFGDFVLEVDVRNEQPGNSGIQVRSALTDDGRLCGYQIEIDPSQRAWSGGLYDEYRRGWLDDLDGDDYARSAFRPGQWNRYRIECVGPSIRAWVNGIPTADHLDPYDLAGRFGLQVHSGNDTRVRWRFVSLRDLGTRAWEPRFDGATLAELAPEGCVYEVRDGRLVGPTACFGKDGRGGGRLVIARGLSDFALRAKLRTHGGAELRVRFREALHGPGGHRGLVDLGGPLVAAADTLLVDGSRGALAERLADGETHALALSVFGDRAAVHLDGRLLVDRRALPGPAVGDLVLDVRGLEGCGVVIESLELLGEP